MMVSSGPFGLSSFRMTNASEGRGVGIPLCTGIQLTDEVRLGLGYYEAELLTDGCLQIG